MHEPDSLNLKIVRKETAFLLKKCFDTEGVLNGSIQFESGLCSSCSQKIEKIFTTARMLGFSLKFSDAANVSCRTKLGNIGKHESMRYEDYECFWKNASSLVDVLLKLTVHSSVLSSRVTLPETFCFKRGLLLTLLVGLPGYSSGSYLIVNKALEIFSTSLLSTHWLTEAKWWNFA